MMATVLQAQGMDRYVVVNTAIFTPATLAACSIGAVAFGATGAGLSFALLTSLRALRLAAGTGLLAGS
jgi:hypothetical protein